MGFKLSLSLLYKAPVAEIKILHKAKQLNVKGVGSRERSGEGEAGSDEFCGSDTL